MVRPRISRRLPGLRYVRGTNLAPSPCRSGRWFGGAACGGGPRQLWTSRRRRGSPEAERSDKGLGEVEVVADSLGRSPPGFHDGADCRLRRSEEHTSELQSLTNLVCR